MSFEVNVGIVKAVLMILMSLTKRERYREIVSRTSVATHALQVGGDGTGALSETVVRLGWDTEVSWFGNRW
jgi:hypothetical protein